MTEKFCIESGLVQSGGGSDGDTRVGVVESGPESSVVSERFYIQSSTGR